MKHDNSFLLIIFLLLAGCGQKDRAKSQFESSVQTEESYPLAKEYIKEAVITGKVLNRDFYPQERELTLIIPFFWKMENQYRTPIQEDGSFSFRFPVYAKLREVSIRNYAEHLYIHPGDSIHVEIDFKDLFHPKVTGDAEKLNQGFVVFCSVKLRRLNRDIAAEFTRMIQGIPEVTECYNISGSYDYLLKIHAPNMKYYQEFILNVLGTIDSLGSLESTFVMDEVKHEYGIHI